MTPIKIIAILVVLIGITLPFLAFTGESLSPGEITVYQTSYAVDTGSQVVINYEFYETFGTRDYVMELEGSGNDLFLSTTVNLDFKEVYYGSFTFNAPTTPGTYTYKTHTYMWAPHPTTGVMTKVEFSYDVRTITVAVSEPPPETYTLTVNAEDENNQALQGVEVSINTGVLGLTDASGTISEPDLLGSYTVTGTKLGYNSDSTTVDMTQDRTVILTLVYIPPTYTLTFEVEDINEQPITGVEISLNGVLVSTTDANGILVTDKLGGVYTVTAVKAGYNPAVLNIDVSDDQTIPFVLTAVATPTPTPDPTEEPTATPNETATVVPTSAPPSTGGSSSSSSDDDEPVVIIYTLSIEVIDEEKVAIEDAKIAINGNEYYTDDFGISSMTFSPGEEIELIITKDGYNTFQDSYTIDEDVSLKISLPESGGQFFFDLDLKSNNPFYDPDGLFGAIPYSVVIISILLIGAGVVLLMRTKK